MRDATGTPILGEDTSPTGLAWSLRFPLAAEAPARVAEAAPEWEWQHYDLAHSAAGATLEAAHDFPAFALQTMSGSDDTCRIVTNGQVVAGVLPGFARSGGRDQHEVTYWRYVLQPHGLVTGRRHPTRTLRDLWQAVQDGNPPAAPADLVNRGIADFARQARARLASLDNDLDAVEVAVAGRGPDRSVGLTARIGAARRETTELRRALLPLARTLEDDVEDLPQWAASTAHDHARRLVLACLDDVAALHDRTRSLQDEVASLQAEEINRRLYIVSVLAVLVMPPTLITGFFGMNVGGMPWAGDDHPLGTLWATLVCIGSVVVVFGVLRWRRLI